MTLLSRCPHHIAPNKLNKKYIQIELLNLVRPTIYSIYRDLVLLVPVSVGSASMRKPKPRGNKSFWDLFYGKMCLGNWIKIYSRFLRMIISFINNLFINIHQIFPSFLPPYALCAFSPHLDVRLTVEVCGKASSPDNWIIKLFHFLHFISSLDFFCFLFLGSRRPSCYHRSQSGRTRMDLRLPHGFVWTR